MDTYYYDKYLMYKHKVDQLLNTMEGGAKKKKKSKSKSKSKSKAQTSSKSTVDNQQMLIDLINKNDLDGVTELLKNNKLDVNHKDDNGNTPLHYAVTESSELVKFLISKGANVNAVDNDNHTPLHVTIAAKISTKKKLKIIYILFENDAKINKFNNEGNTALHFAVIYNVPEAVKALLGEDAKKKIKNDDGKTPLDLAKKYFKKDGSMKKIVKLLDPNYKKDKKDEYIIVSTGSPSSSPFTPVVTYDDDLVSSSPTVVTYGSCTLNFNNFISEFFQRNSSQLFSLMKFEGHPINMMLRCVNEETYRRNVNLGMQTSFSIGWQQKVDLWELYMQKLEQRLVGQELKIQKGECWSEPIVDLYLLFLIIMTRDLIRDKGLHVCSKNYNPTGDPWIQDPKNKAVIEPTYNVNINDGSDYANIKIRRTFEDILKMLINAKPRSNIKYRSYMGSYMTFDFIYTQ